MPAPPGLNPPLVKPGVAVLGTLVIAFIWTLGLSVPSKLLPHHLTLFPLARFPTSILIIPFAVVFLSTVSYES